MTTHRHVTLANCTILSASDDDGISAGSFSMSAALEGAPTSALSMSSSSSSGSATLLMLHPVTFGFDNIDSDDDDDEEAEGMPPPTMRRKSSTGTRVPMRRASLAEQPISTPTRPTHSVSPPQKETIQVRSFTSRLAAACLEPDPTRPSELRWRTRYVDIALMFLDISGYSSAATKLARHGAHALADAVNAYHARILQVVVGRYAGDVITFAGDAVLVAWNYESLADSCERALRCAMDVQHTCGVHVIEMARGDDEDEEEDGESDRVNNPASTDTSVRGADNITMSLHIGLTCGHTCTQVLHPRGSKQYFHFVGGEALQAVERVVDSAASGEVCISAPFAATLPSGVVRQHHNMDADVIRVDALGDETDLFGAVSGDTLVSKKARFRPRKEAGRKLAGATAALHAHMISFVPPVVYSKMMSGFDITDLVEMRHLHVMFIKASLSVDVSIWFDELFAVLNEHRVSVVQVLEDDKGLHIIAAVNLYITENNASDHAVKVARALRTQDLGFYMGVASGPVFCGIVGSVHARRWDITGAACVRACRLMQFAELEGIDVAFDTSLVDTLSEYSFVRLYRDDVCVKGSDDPVCVFALRQCHGMSDLQLNSLCGLTHFAFKVREHERTWIRRNVLESAQTRHACLIVGGTRFGKKYLALSALHGTAFVSVKVTIQPSPSNSPMSMCRPIFEWFAFSTLRAVRDVAQRGVEACRRQQMSRAAVLFRALITTSLSHGLHVAIIVDRAENLTDDTMKIITDALTTPGADDADTTSLSGRWYWMICLRPAYDGCSEHDVKRCLPNGEMPMLHLGPLSVQEIRATFESWASMRLSYEAGVFYRFASGGSPGVFRDVISYYSQFSYRRYKQLFFGGKQFCDATDAELASLFSFVLQGMIYLQYPGMHLYTDIHIRTARPQLAEALQREVDVVPPTHLVVLKLLAVANFDGLSCPRSIVQALFAPTTGFVSVARIDDDEEDNVSQELADILDLLVALRFIVPVSGLESSREIMRPSAHSTLMHNVGSASTSNIPVPEAMSGNTDSDSHMALHDSCAALFSNGNRNTNCDGDKNNVAYRFRLPQMRQVISDMLTPKQRRALARSVLDAHEQRLGEAKVKQLPELWIHFGLLACRAKQQEKALRYTWWIRAMQKKERQLQPKPGGALISVFSEFMLERLKKAIVSNSWADRDILPLLRPYERLKGMEKLPLGGPRRFEHGPLVNIYPPLVLGPFAGELYRFGCALDNSNYNKSESIPLAPIDVDEYMAMVRLFNEYVTFGGDITDNSTDIISIDEERTLLLTLNSALADNMHESQTPQQIENFSRQAMRLLEYVDNVVCIRSRRLTTFMREERERCKDFVRAHGLSSGDDDGALPVLSATEKPLTPTETLWHALWLLLSDRAETAPDAVLVQALMTLGTSGWNGGYEHFSLFFVRDTYFRGDLDLSEVRGVFFMFLIQVLARQQLQQEESVTLHSIEGATHIEEEIVQLCEADEGDGANHILSPLLLGHDSGSGATNDLSCAIEEEIAPCEDKPMPTFDHGGLLGRSSPSELVQGMFMSPTPDAALRRIFDSFGPDPATGCISVAAFKRAYAQLERFGVPEPTERALDDLVRRHCCGTLGRPRGASFADVALGGVSYAAFTVMMLAHVRQ
eukprot:PhM_4_TR363/c0_g1_i1/m.16300